MPEMPEVQGLVDFLDERLRGRTISEVRLVAFTALKTFAIGPETLHGGEVTGVARHGKWLDVAITTADGERHLVFHLARAGWLRWYDEVPRTTPRPSPKSPLALRVVTDAGTGFDLTEAGTRRKLAVYVVADPTEVPMVATLGPDPLAEDFTREALRDLLTARNQQVKGLLRDQSSIAGIGNAYSDEILHVARISPFAQTRAIAADEDVLARLHDAIGETLHAAVATSSGKPAAELKDAKRSGMRVHGRTGEACPVCGDVVREVSFADSSLQYCATCQTGGKVLADRRMSKLLK
ncbi:MAG TPA: DNA-formamidopyrimidine glycosylase family protein [Actinotalea caeni]|uniref:Fpg/Nei family DNA glycosylase n=1 Tax=Actinotalea caeni TaxID=1348467 RepID=UPI002B4B4CAA|nr:DNA-formamidopyrimidine glycosylase family protein [Actinotalea caeni]HLV56338.1 DNA-formamidopyrimidine glycosylase family protein [Actinotalea caeni]